MTELSKIENSRRIFKSQTSDEVRQMAKLLQQIKREGYLDNQIMYTANLIYYKSLGGDEDEIELEANK